MMNIAQISRKTIPIPREEIDSLASGKHGSPHQILGLHPHYVYTEEGKREVEGKKIVLWRPGADQIYFELYGKIVQPECVDDRGLFCYTVPETTTPLDYRIYHNSQLLAHDPYAFSPHFDTLDAYLFATGVHYELYKIMGAQSIVHGRYPESKGVRFTVWAPNAKSVSLVADFNHWNGRTNPLHSLQDSGVWEIFVPGLEEGEKYKFEIRTQSNEVIIKSDPFAFSGEIRPRNASVVSDVTSFAWSDHRWRERQKQALQQPMNIYEVHLSSWKKMEKEFPNYREIAPVLAQYCKEMGFTHVELMPIAEHPLDESWGYQVTGFYAVSSRYGTPEDFQFFVDTLHKEGIGVILDWVPAHFPNDASGLSTFDGTCLYEHQDERQRIHPHWKTSIFNYGRKEVSNFLIANALFWFDLMHIDGLRVDAVASMLYLDYGKEEGEWIPNAYGGKENLEAIEFIKHLNSIVHSRFPHVLMIAEESTSFSGVSHPLQEGGLGFDMKWNMGWMNDTLHYFQKDPLYRSHHHNDLTFGLLYAFSEKFTLVLSHDEVVHGKKSLISKMPGDHWQKFANLRLLYSYMICQPGKKLLFMGGELAQWNEWDCKKELDWMLLHYPIHVGIQTFVKELNHFYLQNEALWKKDFDPTGFEWIDFSDTENSVISYKRKSDTQQLICIHNFTPNFVENYRIHFSGARRVEEKFNSDHCHYGGSGKTNREKEIPLIFDSSGNSSAFEVQLAPLATMIFSLYF